MSAVNMLQYMKLMKFHPQKQTKLKVVEIMKVKK